MADYSNPRGMGNNLPTVDTTTNGRAEMIEQNIKVGSTVTSVYSSSTTAAKGVLVAPESLEISNVFKEMKQIA